MIHAVDFFAGSGALSLGVKMALGPGEFRSVGYVERDGAAAATLISHMENAALDTAPVFDNIEAFPSRLYRNRVDFALASPPCQPFSGAGRGLGTSDERWLGVPLMDAVRDMGCWGFFLENVPGFASPGGGLDYVSGRLAEMGWDAEWGCFRADEVDPECPHRRDRFFLLALADAHSLGNRREPGNVGEKKGAEGRAGNRSPKEPFCGGAEVADAQCGGFPSRKQRPRSSAPGFATQDGGALADADRDAIREQPRGGRGTGRENPAGVSLPWPPRPTDALGWQEWIDAGGPSPTTESRVCGNLNGAPAGLGMGWADALRLAGNSVVPLQVAGAFSVLADRLANQ